LGENVQEHMPCRRHLLPAVVILAARLKVNDMQAGRRVLVKILVAGKGGRAHACSATVFLYSNAVLNAEDTYLQDCPSG